MLFTQFNRHEPVHEIAVFIAHAQLPPLSAHSDVSREARFLIFGLSLPLLQICVYASSKGPGDSAHMRRIA